MLADADCWENRLTPQRPRVKDSLYGGEDRSGGMAFCALQAFAQPAYVYNVSLPEARSVMTDSRIISSRLTANRTSLSRTASRLIRVAVCAMATEVTLQAAPLFQQTDVFVSGQDGYFAYRIPAIETAPDGTLLAFAEGRKYKLGDPGSKEQDIDLVLKRSTDQGATWSPMKIIEDPGEKWSAANPCTLVDRGTGLVWLFYLRSKPGRNTYTARPGTRDVEIFARTSGDNGASWSEPIDLTKATRDLSDPKWRVSVVGPGGGICTRDGRLAIPVWRFAPWSDFAVFSTDHGRTWQRGDFVPGVVGDECQLIELADGRLLMDIRQHRGTHRWRATSQDGGRTWSKPFAGEAVSPVACAIEQFTLKSAGDDRDRILWTGPKGPGRSNLVVRVSYDEGKTFPRERPIAKGFSAYSDLTILKDKTVGVLWERGEKTGYQFITFTRFNREWLEPGNSATSNSP
jgi:sialidase-1